MINIVSLEDGSKYALDAAFGGDGPTLPMPLTDGVVHNNLGTQQIRYSRSRIVQQIPSAGVSSVETALNGPVRDNISPSELPPDKNDIFNFWVYQYRNHPTKPWNSYYCFNETPYLYADFRIMSFSASAINGSSPFQTLFTLGVRFVRADAKEGEIPKLVGKMMMADGTFKEFGAKGSTEIVKVCNTEEERIEALQKYFGITLTEAEQAGIKGRVTELKGGPDKS
jgi:arylamine N-acetyltransferase